MRKLDFIKLMELNPDSNPTLYEVPVGSSLDYGERHIMCYFNCYPKIDDLGAIRSFRKNSIHIQKIYYGAYRSKRSGTAGKRFDDAWNKYNRWLKEYKEPTP